MFMDIFNVIIRSLGALAVLFFITKLIGRKQVSELSLFDYVIGISIGNFAAEIVLNYEIPYVSGVIAVITFGVVAYIVSVITMKSMCLRRFFIGSPVVVIQDGKILEQSMRKLRIDVNDLLEQIRNNGYFDLDEVAYAIMEANGKINVLPKSENKTVTNKDMKIKTKNASICSNIIIDGKVMENNLKAIGKDEEWLLHELKIIGYRYIKDILLATVDENEKIKVYERNINTKKLAVLE